MCKSSTVVLCFTIAGNCLLLNLGNEDTLLRTHCCRHKCFPARVPFVADTNFVSGTQKLFLILFRSILCAQQMFPSLRNPRNMMSNNVSAAMCPRLAVTLRGAFKYLMLKRYTYFNLGDRQVAAREGDGNSIFDHLCH